MPRLHIKNSRLKGEAQKKNHMETGVGNNKDWAEGYVVGDARPETHATSFCLPFGSFFCGVVRNGNSWGLPQMVQGRKRHAPA